MSNRDKETLPHSIQKKKRVADMTTPGIPEWTLTIDLLLRRAPKIKNLCVLYKFCFLSCVFRNNFCLFCALKCVLKGVFYVLKQILYQKLCQNYANFDMIFDMVWA